MLTSLVGDLPGLDAVVGYTVQESVPSPASEWERLEHVVFEIKRMIVGHDRLVADARRPPGPRPHAPGRCAGRREDPPAAGRDRRRSGIGLADGAVVPDRGGQDEKALGDAGADVAAPAVEFEVELAFGGVVDLHPGRLSTLMSTEADATCGAPYGELKQ